MAEKQRKRQGIVNSTKLPFRHFQGKDLSKFRRIPAEFRHLEEKERKRKGKETDRRFWNHSINDVETSHRPFSSSRFATSKRGIYEVVYFYDNFT